MGKWTLSFLLLLPLTVCYDSGVTLEKTIGSEPDVTPLCTNSTLEPITLLVCKIRTERNRGEECRLFYVHGRDFEHRCDSRFTLMEKTQTIFLHLTSLTPVDSGNHTCECSFPGGTDVLHLHITVEGVTNQNVSIAMTDVLHLNITVEDPAASYEWFSISHLSSVLYYVVIGGSAAVILVTGVVLGYVLGKKHSRHDTRSVTSGLSVCETACALDQNKPDDSNHPYTSLQKPESRVYETVFSVHHEDGTKTNSANNNTVTAHLDIQEVEGRETDQVCEIYENF